MRVTINGKSFNFNTNKNIIEILEDLEIRQGQGIAVAVNETVISRNRFHEVFVHEGDSVEIIRATAGG